MISAQEIRKSMRITHDALDDEINRNMNACLLDLKRVGIAVSKKKKDELFDKAMELYCKAQLDYQGKGDIYNQSYERLRDALSLTGEYKDV